MSKCSESDLLLNSVTLSSALVSCIHAPVHGALRESLSFKQKTWYEALIVFIFSSSEILYDLHSLLNFHSSLRVHELNSAIPMAIIFVLLFGVELCNIHMVKVTLFPIIGYLPLLASCSFRVLVLETLGQVKKMYAVIYPLRPYSL